MLHGRHKEQTEILQFSKLQRAIEEKRKAIMKEMNSHVNKLDNKIDKKLKNWLQNIFQVTKMRKTHGIVINLIRFEIL